MLDEKTVWHDRYRSITDLERHLHGNGTRIIKFFLHLSKEEQRKRFLERIDEPEKNWKFSLADIEERKFWKHYMKAYEECLSATSTSECPMVCRARRRQGKCPADRVPDCPRHAEGLKMTYPKTSPEAPSRNCCRSVDSSRSEMDPPEQRRPGPGDCSNLACLDITHQSAGL